MGRPPWTWDTQREEAAAALAAGDAKTKIARDLGVNVKTIYNWASNPDFQKRVEHFKGLASESVVELEIYKQFNRGWRQNAEWLSLQTILDERRLYWLMRREDLALLVGETNDNKMLLPSVKRARIAAIREDPAYHPGITTGWIVVSYTTVAKSAVPEYKIDKDLSECLSRLEMNFAREHGQLAAEKRELSGKDGTPIEFSSPDVAKAAQELSAWRAQMNQALSSISSAPPT